MILDATGANEAEGGEPAAAPAGARQAPPPMPSQLILEIAVPAGGFPGPRVTLKSPPYGKFTVAVPAGAVPGSKVRVTVWPSDRL